MAKSEPLVIGIEGVMRNHPIPLLPNFKIVPWSDISTIKKADVFIQTNIKENKHKNLLPQYEYIENSGKPWIVAEAAVFRKNMPKPPHPKAYHRYSWFSYFRDEGDYNNKNCSPDRWYQIQKDQKIEIKDWKSRGDYILLILQRPGDSSLKNLLEKYQTYENFLMTILSDIRQHTDRPVRVRLHPLRQDRQLKILNNINLDNIQVSKDTSGSTPLEGGKGLEKDFNEAWAVVGFNSNALTESVCEGIPTFSLCPSSMAWECSNKDLKNLEKPQIYDRNQWLYNLGYCQWREDEIERGDPWYHLLEVMTQNHNRIL